MYKTKRQGEKVNENQETEIRKKTKNTDNLCLARALVLAKARIDKDPHLDTIKRGESSRKTLQQELAKKLQKDVGLEHFDQACRLDEVQKFQDYLTPDYQIKIYSKDHYNGLIYKGPKAEKILHLFLHDHHFDIITKVPAFLGKSYYCDICDKGYSNSEDHCRIKQGCLGC
uniref:Uncharacterized protein n=1 Tax=Romanomermis culicivorax TaxID=13658 RepID=A0A915IHY8_ROMCU